MQNTIVQERWCERLRGKVKSANHCKVQGGPKKRPILFFIPKLCFTIFFNIFQMVQTADLGDSFDTNMGPTGRYTTQHRMKINEVYFAAKSVLLTQRQCRKDFGRNNVPDGRTIQRLVGNFRKTGSVADAHKGRHCSSFGVIPENIQNLWERHEESPRKSTRRLLQETGISRTSVFRTLHDDLKLFLYKIQILQRQTDQNEAERETFWEDISQRIENDPDLLDLNDLNDFDHCGLCGASATLLVSRNLATKH